MEAHIVFLFVCGLLLFLQSAGRVKCEKSKQPNNDQNRSDYRESGSENIYPNSSRCSDICDELLRALRPQPDRPSQSRDSAQRMPGAFN
jgi:hypothetical protein